MKKEWNKFGPSKGNTPSPVPVGPSLSPKKKKVKKVIAKTKTKHLSPSTEKMSKVPVVGKKLNLVTITRGLPARVTKKKEPTYFRKSNDVGIARKSLGHQQKNEIFAPNPKKGVLQFIMRLGE